MGLCSSQPTLLAALKNLWISLSRSYSVADATERPTLDLPCERTYLRIDELGFRRR